MKKSKRKRFKSDKINNEIDLSLLEDKLISVLRENPHQTFTIKILGNMLGIDTPQFTLIRACLEHLAAQNMVLKPRSGKYQWILGEEDLHEGVVALTSSGMAYVTVSGFEKDFAVNSKNTVHVLHGDVVKVVLYKHKKRTEAEIIEVVKHSEQSYVGRIEVQRTHAFVIVNSRTMPYDIFVPIGSIKNAQDGYKVKVRIVEWPDNVKNPIGEVVEVFGKAGDHNAEMHAILAEYDLPSKFAPEVERQAEKISEEISAAEIGKRRDFRSVTTFTIDPADAKDFDDALSIRTLSNGNFEVGVHIADVTHYVTGGALEQEAQNRATSVYLVDRTVPMLPERLSNNICSLMPDVDRLCFSAVFEMTQEAEVVNSWFGRTVIHSDRRFAYEEAQEIIETETGDYCNEILTLNGLAQILRKNRFKNGSVNFERDEAKFQLDETGKPLGVYFKQSKEANHLIEEFMLLANRYVAEFIGRKKSGGKNNRTFVYRIHDKPNEDKFLAFKGFIAKLGYQFKADKGKAISKELNRLMKKIAGKPEENLISTLAIRSMAKAVYSTDNIGHYGLSFDYYTHFTSPIRRYPDMMVHRLLAHYLAEGASEDKDKFQELCDHSSEMEQRAADAERDSIRYKMVEFMMDKIDVEFDGFITNITEWNMYIELEENRIEGVVALRDIADDYYTFDKDNFRVIGRLRGRTISLGDRVRIRIKRADLARKLLEFILIARYNPKNQNIEHIEYE